MAGFGVKTYLQCIAQVAIPNENKAAVAEETPLLHLLDVCRHFIELGHCQTGHLTFSICEYTSCMTSIFRTILTIILYTTLLFPVVH